eukprot:SAG11_NODE_130_length_15497_cov_10.780556_7_plen_369_part_00
MALRKVKPLHGGKLQQAVNAHTRTSLGQMSRRGHQVGRSRCSWPKALSQEPPCEYFVFRAAKICSPPPPHPPPLPFVELTVQRRVLHRLVSAGIHGNEYDGMLAIRRVWEELDATQLSGTFVGIMCCNVDAHLVPHRNSAYDGQNLARVFPGKPDGTLTERVAFCIQHDFIEKATLMCDLHTAGLDMRMIPIVGYTLNPPPHNPDSLEQARAAAKAFGLKTVWSNAVAAGAPELTYQRGDDVPSPFSKGTSGVGAWLAGVPFLYTEATGCGGIWNRDIDLYAQGVRNLIRHLGIDSGPAVEPVAGQVIVEDFTEGSGDLQHQHITPVGGLFHAETELYENRRIPFSNESANFMLIALRAPDVAPAQYV